MVGDTHFLFIMDITECHKAGYKEIY